MREFDSILNDSETYGDKLAEFLKRKTAIKPQSNNPFVLGGFDVSIDIDVDLVKLPPKVELKDGKEKSASKQPLRELTSNAENNEENNDRLPKADDNAPTLSPQKNEKNSPSTSATSPSNSINNRKSIRRSVPGSDRLRRVAIQRRSRSCGRRDLLQEFNNATLNNTEFVSISGFFMFSSLLKMKFTLFRCLQLAALQHQSGKMKEMNKSQHKQPLRNWQSDRRPIP